MRESSIALKIVRQKLIAAKKLPEGAASSLSPVSSRELKALEFYHIPP